MAWLFVIAGVALARRRGPNRDGTWMNVETSLAQPLTLFIAQAGLIIGLSQLIGVFIRKVAQPMVIAEVVAGIVLGPSVLGALWPEAWIALFPASSLPTLHLFSQVGLIFFMFVTGLEVDPTLLRGRGRSSVLISYASIVVPFGLGALLAWGLYPSVSGGRVAVTSFVLFMGAAMSITAFPVLARILTEQGMLRSSLGSIAIACAAIDDVTAWCILAFVVSVARGAGLVDAVHTTLAAAAYAALMLGVVRPALARLGSRPVAASRLTPEFVAVSVLCVLASAWITELIGIHALFGAFVLGAIVPRGPGHAGALAARLHDMTVGFLLPLFFAYSGLRTEIGLLDSLQSWGICALIVGVACLGKFGGSAVAARIAGHRWRESAALGILINTRGLMELIVLNIGLDLGVIPPMVFTMMVFMALVTTFMTTPLLNLVYPGTAADRELAAADAVGSGRAPQH